jgi:hypothetical protein
LEKRIDPRDVCKLNIINSRLPLNWLENVENFNAIAASMKKHNILEWTYPTTEKKHSVPPRYVREVPRQKGIIFVLLPQYFLIAIRGNVC